MGWGQTSRFATTRISPIRAVLWCIPRLTAVSISIAIIIRHPDSIKAVRVRVAPLVMDLCNKKDITRGLEGKYSIYHSSAVGLVRGKAGLQEYTDAAVNDPIVKRVRERVSAIADTSITEDQADIEVELQDGRKLVRFIEQSLGNVHRPLSDRQLEDKLRDQCIPALSASQVDRLIELCWKIDKLDDVNELVKATVRS